MHDEVGDVRAAGGRLAVLHRDDDSRPFYGYYAREHPRGFQLAERFGCFRFSLRHRFLDFAHLPLQIDQLFFQMPVLFFFGQNPIVQLRFLLEQLIVQPLFARELGSLKRGRYQKPVQKVTTVKYK